GMKWNKIAETRVDRFLMSWREIRPRVLDRVFHFYKKMHPEVRRVHDNPAALFLLPAPTAPEVVADLFRVSTIHLHDNDATVGISGGCPWDLENLWGGLIW